MARRIRTVASSPGNTQRDGQPAILLDRHLPAFQRDEGPCPCATGGVSRASILAGGGVWAAPMELAPRLYPGAGDPWHHPPRGGSPDARRRHATVTTGGRHAARS